MCPKASDSPRLGRPAPIFPSPHAEPPRYSLMATAIKKSTSPRAAAGEPVALAREPLAIRMFDSIYRFLASLKLAVLSISCLAGVLAYATFFESWYGTAAAQECIYKGPGFAILLTFLGTNILCAALIRFPWTKRQTGFVITHAGLLTVLLGSWISFKVTDDGQVGMVEGAESNQLIRLDHAAIRVETLDQNGRPEQAYKLPFHPGTFPWENDRLQAIAADRSPLVRPAAYGLAVVFGLATAAFGLYWMTTGIARIRPGPGAIALGALALLCVVPLGYASTLRSPRIDLLTDETDPFQIKIKEYYPASGPPRFAPVAGSAGDPMIRLTYLVKPPRAREEIDVFADPSGRDQARWLVAANPKFRRASRDTGSALVAFQFVDTSEKVDDFLTLPADPLKDELARIHYKDQSGRRRVYSWPVAPDEKEGKSVTLPDSELVVAYQGRGSFPLGGDDGGHAEAMLQRVVGDAELHVVKFQVKRGNGASVEHVGWGSMPMLPSVIPTAENRDAREIVRIAYYHPPQLGRVALQGRAGVLEIMGTADGKLYYRAFGREGLRGKGPVETQRRIDMVSGPNQPVSAAFRVDTYLTSGVRRDVCEPLVLPKAQRDQGIPACLAEMTVKGETREFWLRRSVDFTEEFETVDFPGGRYRVAFDFDRSALPFSVKLVDFEMGTDPGTQQASKFVSQVLLNDPRKGIDDRPVTISMNRPMIHGAYTFYQSNYVPMTDPQTRQRTGQFMSIFQVRYDPVWGIIYGGCLLVVLGTFVQFYMRAGVFTDGGKKERARGAARARAASGKQGGADADAAPLETVDQPEEL
jgi:hypothetical protein